MRDTSFGSSQKVAFRYAIVQSGPYLVFGILSWVALVSGMALLAVALFSAINRASVISLGEHLKPAMGMLMCGLIGTYLLRNIFYRVKADAKDRIVTWGTSFPFGGTCRASFDDILRIELFTRVEEFRADWRSRAGGVETYTTSLRQIWLRLRDGSEEMIVSLDGTDAKVDQFAEALSAVTALPLERRPDEKDAAEG